VQACFYPSPTDIEMLSDKHAEDQIVAFGTTCLESLRDREWTFFLTETQQHEAQTCMKWVMDTWNYDEGKPKIGLVGHSGALPTEAHLDGVTTFLEANPDKFDWVGSQASPMGTTAWAVEAMALMECDYIMPVTYGTSTGTFIKEIRARGYTGSLLATSLAFPGYWNIIRSIVPEDDLFGCYHSHWMPWVGDNAFATDWRAAITEYRAGAFADAEGQQASYGTGWAWGILLTDIIKRAVEEVGVDAVDGVAIRDAAMSTSLDLTASGWGNPWELSADDNLCAATSEMHEWDVDEEVWVNISDPIVV